MGDPKRNNKTDSKGNLLYYISLPLFVVSISILILIGIAVIYGVSNRGVSSPKLMGNRPENIERIESVGEEVRPFAFFVAGDHHLGNHLRLLYPTDIKGSDYDFGILVGDFLRKPNRERNDYFLMQFYKWGIDRPIFIVTGNHDVLEGEEKEPRIKYGDLPNGFGLDDFRSVYGPDNFSFKFSGCLFIGLNDIDISAEDGSVDERYIEFLEDVLEREAKDARMIFVFMHIPPFTRADHIYRYPTVESERFRSLIEGYGVDYVFSGHFHSYLRGTVGKTNYIISGGGLNKKGGKLKEQSRFHAMMIYVDPVSGTVHERIYTACDNKISREWDWIKVTIYSELWPPIKYFGGIEDLSDQWEVPVVVIFFIDILVFAISSFILFRFRKISG